MFPLFLLSLLSGCEEAPTDLDADGVSAALDCDDHNPDVHPGAEERCDGVDQDCDGFVDDDVPDQPLWYPDADGDGFGDTMEGVGACEAPEGYVADRTDCDSTNPDISPSGREVCNGLDDDCDDQTDDEDDSLEGAQDWFRDADGDGWGAGTPTQSCLAPTSFVSSDGDCDDTDDDVSPSAVEVCDPDDVDEDCDGLGDDASAADRGLWYADADGDGHGDSEDAGLLLCDPTDGRVHVADDCDDSDPSIAPDAPEWCDGVDEDCNGQVDDDPLDLITWWGDTDGDGYGDATATVEACSQPAGAAANPDDCDDTRADVSPAGTEVCDGADNNCDTTTDESGANATSWYLDADADGYGDPATETLACLAPGLHVADDQDCDDADSSAHPGGTEMCGGGDEDCDGAVDTSAIDALIWYDDSDGDGYGSAAVWTEACDAPTGAVADASDCDDGRADVNPGVAERCDTDDTDEDCDGLADDADTGASGTVPWYFDVDADGYGDVNDSGIQSCDPTSRTAATATDCDDTEALVSPAGVETCDGVDEDCDGVIDPTTSLDALTWYLDLDADTHGDATATTNACLLPTGYSATADDCDDLDVSVSPDGVEVCNSVDDDCDGGTDEDAADFLTWYLDSDGDGHGDGGSVEACTLPAGYASVDTDCDDADAAVSPDATEVCDTADVDEDCDGLVDDDDADVSGQQSQWPDLDGDGYGVGSERVACDLATGNAANDTDCDDDNAAVHPDAGETCDNFIDDDCDESRDPCGLASGSLSDADLVISNTTANDYLGAVVSGGDLNSDGYADLVVGAYGYDPSSATSNAGQLWIWYGPLGTEALATADATISGTDAGDRLGFSLAALGDTDADGAVELLLGGDGYDGTASDVGGAWIIESGTTSVTADDAYASFAGATSTDYLGYDVAAGDLNGDGEPDVVTGAHGGDGGGSSAGALFLWVGPVSGAYDGNDAHEILDGGAAGDEAGYAVAAADLDGDGVDEVIFGAPYADSPGSAAGAVYVQTYTGGNTDVTGASTTLTGVRAGDQLGCSLSTPGDHDGDGLADLLVGANLYDNGAVSGAGAAWLILGDSSGIASGSVTDVDAAQLSGIAANDRAGDGVAGGGDIDGDGQNDLLVGAQRAGSSDAGAIYLLYGPTSGTIELSDASVTWTGVGSGETAGRTLAILGDVDDDGHDDIGIGVQGTDTTSANAVGAAYVYYGWGW